MRFGEVQDIIDNLYKISVRIRQPTIKSRSLKAASYQPKDPQTGIDILDQYAVFDLRHTQELMRHLREVHRSRTHVGEVQDGNSILTNRLARAVTLRRRQFKYWSRHREKLGVSTVTETPMAHLPLGRPELPHRSDTTEAQPEPLIPKVLHQAPSQKTGKTLLSGTEVTRHHQSLDDIVDSKSVTSYATTVRDLTGKGIDLPPPPKAADGGRDFECPYCFIICPARYGRGRPWKTHVLQDLQPYVCTYEECELPDQLFRSRKEWIQHEASHRKAWRCPEHPDAVYTSRDGLRDHLRRNHGDSFPESHLDSIVKVGETSTVDTRPICPICHAPAHTEGMNFQNHLANHLERIATFALPTNSEDDVDDASSHASRGRTDSSGSQDLRDVSFPSSENNVRETEEAQPHASTQSLADQMLSTTSSPRELIFTQGLSESLLRDLPDARQNRLDILFASQRTESEELREVGAEDIAAEVEELMSQTEAFKKYLLSMPGANSVRFHQRYEPLRGAVHFKDETSATAALKLFDRDQYPNIILLQDEKASLRFSTLQEENAGTSKSRQPRSDTGTIDSKNSSYASSSMSYKEQEGDQVMPTISALETYAIRSLYRSGTLSQREQTYAPNDAYNRIISFLFSSLTLLKVDAIVNSANRSMQMTRNATTLNNSVHKAAGPELQKEVKGMNKMRVCRLRTCTSRALW
jgi:hypothetical protein